MSTTSGWIDFRALRENVEFSQVLALYNVKLKVKGDQAQGFCPLPRHSGQKKSPSFSVNLPRGIWKCFGSCATGGNVIDFVACMEGFDPKNGKDIRKAAQILQEKLGRRNSLRPAKQSEPKADSPSLLKPDLPVVINAPLDFELKNLDPKHPYLERRGFDLEIIKLFGLGFCNRGMLKDRIAIPIHDGQGRLVAYGGRVVNDESINDENPKYKLPPPRERDGNVYEFHKAELLYNAHRIRKKVSDLIVVEGFPGTWWLVQNDYPHTIAVMGSDCSEAQATLILEKVEIDGHIWVLTDGDDAGRRLAESLLVQLSPYRFVKWAKLREGQQPTDCTSDDLQAMLSV